mgnify:CR=1 FL=1
MNIFFSLVTKICVPINIFLFFFGIFMNSTDLSSTHASEGFKSLTSNATNLVLFKHRRSKQQINIFLRQIGSGNLSSVYHNVTGSLPFSYLAIDLHPQSVAEFKVYSHMLYCEEKSMVLFDCE